LLCYFFDIFWVFYSQGFFGESVMVYVAKNLDLPLKLVIPLMNQTFLHKCGIYGLGDIIIPGNLL